MSKRILIVDDTLFMRIKIRALLEKWGYEVVGEGGNGLQAVEKFKELQPDIVLMDITMPEMDGLSALKAIKAIDAKATVIMISALGQETYVMEAIRSGATNYLIKPLQDAKFQDVLSRL